jgi:hypothetical protein
VLGKNIRTVESSGFSGVSFAPKRIDGKHRKHEPTTRLRE